MPVQRTVVKQRSRKAQPIEGGQDEYFAGPIPPVDHGKALIQGVALTATFRRMWAPEAAIVNADDVIRVLNTAGVKFVLMGAHTVAGWCRVARATDDVDLLVHAAHHKKAVQAVRRAYLELQVEDNPAVTRFRDPSDGKVVIDLMKPKHEIHRAVFRHTLTVGTTHPVPDLEMAIACKFAAMTSPTRAMLRKQQDAIDFALIVLHNKTDLNRRKLSLLGDLVCEKGGVDLLRLVDDVLAGRMLVR